MVLPSFGVGVYFLLLLLLQQQQQQQQQGEFLYDSAIEALGKDLKIHP